MRHLIPAILCFAACSAEPAADPAVPDDSDCNLSTELVPGIPGSPGNLIESPRNPNGDSELAALMRDMVDDLRDGRTLLEAGETVKQLYPTHRLMRCAWPTRPEERNEKYDGLAKSYLSLVLAYDSKPDRDSYNGIIAGCIACHSQGCGGPIPYIESMRWQ